MMTKMTKPLRWRRAKGATTVEWVVLAMIIGIAMIAVWTQFKNNVKDTLDNGGQQIVKLKVN
jgi:Flp pilus assembly pilin Flp